MEYGLLVQSRYSSINIGDYIQAIAARQYLPKHNKYVERELLKDYSEEDIAIIMNGWFMHNPNEWPPSKKIHPLFISFHINSTADKLLSPESINYLKKFEPIGCRDKYTEEKLKDKGVYAYFSGCLTLTLGLSFNANVTLRKNIYFVDPFFESAKYYEYPILLIKSIINIMAIRILFKKFHNNYRYYIVKWCNISKFYNIYSKAFQKNVLVNAEYRSHLYKRKDIEKPYSNQCIKIAEDLLKDYSTAQLVVTSRIHCALPCTGLLTPVIFVLEDTPKETSSCRLNGLIELFNTLKYHGGKFDVTELGLKQNTRISIKNLPAYKNNWEKLNVSLQKKCADFIRNTFNS